MKPLLLEDSSMKTIPVVRVEWKTVENAFRERPPKIVEKFRLRIAN